MEKLNEWLNGKGTYIGGILAIIHGLSTILIGFTHGQYPDQLSVAEIIGGWTAVRLRKAI